MVGMSQDRPNSFPVPTDPNEDRLNVGLIHDVAEVLAAHGYPRPVSGADWVELQQALFRLLHGAR